jgi:nucleoside-diphosphate-sugar epimerase
MSTPKTVLVTGSSGFIGSAVVEALAEDGWQVVSTTRIKGVSESTVFLDLSQPESIINIGRDNSFDAIVHLGANIGFSGQLSSELFMPNVLATGLLADLSAKLNAQFVFASAAIVHGIGTKRITFDTPLGPDSAYGKSKWLAEELIAASGVRNCILRIGGVFGLHGPTHLGLNRAITNAVKNVPPQLNGTGEALRNYIYVKDIAAAISFVLQKGVEGTHLLAGNEVISIKNMLQQICDVFIPDQSPSVIEGQEAKSQVITPFDGFPITRSFKDALRDIRKELSK